MYVCIYSFVKLQELFYGDRRVKIIPDSFANVEYRGNDLLALGRPFASAHAVVNIDIDHTDIEEVQEQINRIQTHLLPQAIREFPCATFVVSYPIYGRAYHDNLAREMVRTGVRHALSATYALQDGKKKWLPDRSKELEDTEPWAVGFLISKPPPAFDDTLNELFQHTDLVMKEYWK